MRDLVHLGAEAEPKDVVHEADGRESAEEDEAVARGDVPGGWGGGGSAESGPGVTAGRADGGRTA